MKSIRCAFGHHDFAPVVDLVKIPAHESLPFETTTYVKRCTRCQVVWYDHHRWQDEGTVSGKLVWWVATDFDKPEWIPD